MVGQVMKKIISILILVILTGMVLCSCSHKTYTDSNKSKFQNKFAIIREDESFSNDIYLIYDKETKIVYLYIGEGHRGGLTPYYININGKPTVAIYGVNYEYQE